MQLKRIAPVVSLALAATLSLAAQTAPPGGQQTPGTPTAPSGQQAGKTPRKHITPQQAKELFASVGKILDFASKDTDLPIRHPVKSKLITRPEVEKYLLTKMKDDKDAKRLERSEIVLKKFGLLDKDFQLRPFLVQLLDEQIAAFYDSKTKTVNLLDWVAPATQKPVLAHELTHALQDQYVGLEKWENTTSDDISHNYRQDLHHVATDEDDTAREAVAEGQAMAVFVDYSLAPMGKKLKEMPGFARKMAAASSDLSDSPVMARAPLVLQESLLFPYTEGLEFEATLLHDSKTPVGAFADVLDRPPASSFEIMHPHAYEKHVQVPVLRMPDIHPVIDARYSPYDIGVMGALDVQILSKLFGGDEAAAALTPQWDGGLYYAAQKKDAPDKSSTASVALLYLSQWKTPEAAAAFAKMYANELGNKYSKVVRDSAEESSPDEQVYQTDEGPVLMVTSGGDVFVSESFDLATARKLQLLMLGAQVQGPSELAMMKMMHPVWRDWRLAGPGKVAAQGSAADDDLTGGLVRFMASCGMMKAAMGH